MKRLQVENILCCLAIAYLVPVEAAAEVPFESEDQVVFPFDEDLEVGEWDDIIYETVVEGHRFALSAGATRISRKEIASSHASSTDAVLKLVSGVTLVQHGGAGKGHQIHLRGFDAAHGSDVEAVLLGIGLNEPSHVHGQGYLDLYGIIPETILEMEVLRGPFLPWQGNFATAGSFRFNLGIPSEMRPGLVRAQVSHRGRLRGVVVFAPEESEERTFIATEAIYDHGFGPDREARRAVVMAGYERKIDSDNSLLALFSGQTSRFETPGAMGLYHVEKGLHGFYDTHGQGGQGLSDRLLGRLGFEHDDGNTDLEIFLYSMLRRFSLENNFTGWLLDEHHGDRKGQEHTGAASGAVAALEQKLPWQIPAELFAGVGWRLDRFKQKEQQLGVQGDPWQKNRQTEASIHHLNLHGGLRLAPFSWVTLFPSVRLDVVFYRVEDTIENRRSGDTYVAVSPRLAMGFPVHRTLSLFADYGRGFRMPEARAVVAKENTEEDQVLSQYKGGRPEVSSCDTFEVGFDYQPLEVASFRARGFATFLAREMVFDHVSNLTVEQDGTRRLGLEVEISLMPLRWITTSADFTWVDARFKKSRHPVPGVPSWIAQAAVSLGETIGPYGGIRFLALGKRHLAHGASAAGYTQLTLDIGWRFEHFEVAAVFENAFNQEIMEGVYHYASWFERNQERSAIPKVHYTPGEPFTFRAVFTAYL